MAGAANLYVVAKRIGSNCWIIQLGLGSLAQFRRVAGDDETDSSMMASLASAVSAAGDQAPAWPMRLPGRGVTPAMKPTIGFSMLALHHWAAASSGCANFADHDHGIGVWTVVESLHHVDVLQAVDGVATMPTAEDWPEPTSVS